MTYKVMCYAPGLESEHFNGTLGECREYLAQAIERARQQQSNRVTAGNDGAFIFKHKASFYSLRIKRTESAENDR